MIYQLLLSPVNNWELSSLRRNLTALQLLVSQLYTAYQLGAACSLGYLFCVFVKWLTIDIKLAQKYWRTYSSIVQ